METLVLIREKIDYRQTKLDERKKVVDDILNNVQNDLEEYFDGSYKANLTSKDKLSEEDNVCHTLEGLANYLLNSEEIKKEKEDEEFQYVFHTDEQYFNKKIHRENSIEGMSTGTNEDNVIHFLLNSKKNYKKSKTQIITTKDLLRGGMIGAVLNGYNDELQRISGRLKKGVDNSGKRYLLTRTSGQIKDDMIIVKDQLLGTFGYNSNASESSKCDLEFIDFTNEKHIEALLRITCEFEPNKDLAYIVLAYEQLAKESGLTPHERHVFSLFRQNLKNNEIAPILNVTNQHVTKMSHVIARKLAKEAQRIELMLRTHTTNN